MRDGTVENYRRRNPDFNAPATRPLYSGRVNPAGTAPAGRQSESREKLAYANDYRDITTLKQVADEHGIAIIIVHHLRKLGGSDPFIRVSGTTGLTGAVDSTFVLERESYADSTARLYVTGRDVEYQEFVLSFQECVWQLVRRETRESVKMREVPGFVVRVAEFMEGREKWQGTATDLAAAV